MSDGITIQHDEKRLHMHLSGFHGDGGENEGVLSISAVLDGGPNWPECGLIIVGSPQKSPLIDGYIPNLGAFSCSPDAADRLIAGLQAAVAAVRTAQAKLPTPTRLVVGSPVAREFSLRPIGPTRVAATGALLRADPQPGFVRMSLMRHEEGHGEFIDVLFPAELLASDPALAWGRIFNVAHADPTGADPIADGTPLVDAAIALRAAERKLRGQS